MMALPAKCWVGTRWVPSGCSRGTALGTVLVLECTAAAARRRAARAGLSCTGACVSGVAGSNECPAGSVRIATEAACRTVAAAAGLTPSSFGFVLTNPYAPRGCYYHSTSNRISVAYFNTHAVGAGDSIYRLLCAITNGAPPRARGCSGTARVHRCAGVPQAHVCIYRG
jgi:hypothetical protein